MASLPKFMDRDFVRSIEPTAIESKNAFMLQQLIFQDKFQEVKDYINRNDSSEESQAFRSPYALKLILDSILQNQIKTEEQEGIDFIIFLLSFESVKLAVKSDPWSITTAAKHNCVAAMILFIALDDGEAVSKTDAAAIAFGHEYVQMFKMLISNPRIAKSADIDRIKSNIKFKTDYNRTEHLEEVLRLLNSKQQELHQSHRHQPVKHIFQ